MTIINKKALKYIVIAILMGVTIFMSIYFGIKLRQLELEEIAEQINKFGFYKYDIHINIEREKKSSLYGFLTATPILTTSTILIGNVILDTFTRKEKK